MDMNLDIGLVCVMADEKVFGLEIHLDMMMEYWKVLWKVCMMELYLDGYLDKLSKVLVMVWNLVVVLDETMVVMLDSEMDQY